MVAAQRAFSTLKRAASRSSNPRLDAEPRHAQRERGTLRAQVEVGRDGVGVGSCGGRHSAGALTSRDAGRACAGLKAAVVHGEGPQVLAVDGVALADQARAPLVAGVHDGESGPRSVLGKEEQALGGVVVVDVAVEVEVFAREVRERGDGVLDLGRALEHEGVRRDLHDARLVAGGDHPAQQRLEVGRLGRREDARAGPRRRRACRPCRGCPPAGRRRRGRRPSGEPSSSCRSCR